MSTTAEALTSAFAHHQAGRLREAELLYRQILQAEPEQVDALHLLGLLAHQSGAHDAAIQFISRAILLRGNQATFHSNLGEVYRALGRVQEAIQCYRQALRLDPKCSDAQNNLGNALLSLGQLDEAEAAFQEAIRLRHAFAQPHNNMGLVLERRGDLAGSVTWFQRAIEVDPRYALAYTNLAGVLQTQGKMSEAVVAYRQALALAPENAELHSGLGALYQAQNKPAEAMACYRDALRCNPRSARAHHNLGVVLKDLGQVEGAIASYREALRWQPNQAETHANLAIALADQGDWTVADEEFQTALRLKPDDPGTLCDFGIVLEKQGELDRAMELYQQAATLSPTFAKAHFNVGNICHARKMPAQAIAAYERALAIEPENVDALNNLALVYNDLSQPDRALEYLERAVALAPAMSALHANMQIALHAQGRSDEAVAASRKAMELRPSDAGEHSNYLYTMNFHPQFDAPTIFAEHLAWAARHAEPLTVLAPPHTVDRSPERRLRVGYVSPYFRQHAVNYFVEPVLASHNHEQYEIYCYSDVALPDATTGRLKAAADHWRDVHYRSDEEIARMVRADGIDILVDLTGHIGGNRMLLFARKPAPVQVTYIGYQNTTGMTAMDYRLTDEHADPLGLTDRFHMERLVRLPRAFFCYRPSADAPAVTALPALERRYVTFGSFNNFAKVNPTVIEAWLHVLSRVPDSRLLLLAYRGGYLEAHLKAEAARRGIEPARIELRDKRPRLDYLKLIADADIALDPFPFNGHTTTCDAIWQAVPVVMLQGQTYVSRFGGSVLANVGLESLIAHSIDEYVELAVALAQDRLRLVELRGSLRQSMASSPLLDFEGFTRNLEQAYRKMWRTWCASQR